MQSIDLPSAKFQIHWWRPVRDEKYDMGLALAPSCFNDSHLLEGSLVLLRDFPGGEIILLNGLE